MNFPRNITESCISASVVLLAVALTGCAAPHRAENADSPAKASIQQNSGSVEPSTSELAPGGPVTTEPARPTTPVNRLLDYTDPAVIRSTAGWVAADAGSTPGKAVSWIITTPAKINTIFDTEGDFATQNDMVVIEMTGDFEVPPGPPGTSKPHTGHALLVVFDIKTNDLVMRSIQNEAIDLGKFGKASTLS